MKKLIWGIGLIISLFLNSNSIQNRTLILYLGNKDILNKCMKSLKIATFFKRDSQLIEVISRSTFVSTTIKNYVKAKSYADQGLYERAWEEIKGVADNTEKYYLLKIKVLMSMRSFQELLNFLQNNGLATFNLNEETKKQIVNDALSFGEIDGGRTLVKLLFEHSEA